MALTDAIVRNSKPHPKAYTLKDIQGLTLYVAPSGSKSWHFRYMIVMIFPLKTVPGTKTDLFTGTQI